MEIATIIILVALVLIGVVGVRAFRTSSYRKARQREEWDRREREERKTVRARRDQIIQLDRIRDILLTSRDGSEEQARTLEALRALQPSHGDLQLTIGVLKSQGVWESKPTAIQFANRLQVDLAERKIQPSPNS
jgi:hypothetical protein